MISLLRNLEVEQRSQEWAAEHCSRDTIREVRIAAKESASAFRWYRKCSKTHYIRLDFLSRWMFPSPVLEDLPPNPGSVYDRLQLILEHANCKQVRFMTLDTRMSSTRQKFLAYA